MTTPSPASIRLPLFYEAIEPLRTDHHARVGVRDGIGYAFTRATNAIPLVRDEFALAQAHYPIVFGPPDVPEAYAAVGLRERENLMVTADGGWLPGWYVPAYIRRYPFIFGTLAGSDQYHLCAERGALAPLGGGAGQPLFIAGQPSPVTQEALRICTAYQQQYQETADFVTALHTGGLLAERTVNATVSTAQGPQSLALEGVWVVDEAAFNALPDEVFLDWRRRGWIGLVYAHLLSMPRWGGLNERLSAVLS